MKARSMRPGAVARAAAALFGVDAEDPAVIELTRGLIREVLGVGPQEVAAMDAVELGGMCVCLYHTSGVKVDEALAAMGRPRRGVTPPELPAEDPRAQPSLEEPAQQPPPDVWELFQQQQQALVQQGRVLQSIQLQLSQQPQRQDQQQQRQQLQQDQQPQEQLPVTLFPADAHDVRDWVQPIQDDALGLVTQLEARYVSGLAHAAGGEVLSEAFASLKLFVMGAAYTSNWVNTPFCELGNQLLRQLKVQHKYVTAKIPRRELMLQMAKHDEEAHPVDRAAAVILSRKKPVAKSGFGRGYATAAAPTATSAAQPRYGRGNGSAGRQ
ncbi:hypothetical protein DIPPA_20905 [Diplonema papillatum]|nr:hypothetical protein DIPPA_20905 [Diplonema papillatum]